MSKSTTIQTSTNIKNMGTKRRETSKDRKSTQKRNTTSIENSSVPSTNVKFKPSVKVKEPPTGTANTVRKSSNNDLNKLDSKSKSKPETSVNKQHSIALNKTASTHKSLSSTRQGTSVKAAKSTVVETPSSSRVTKTRYFPSKKLYSNAVQDHLRTNSDNQKANNSENSIPSSRETIKTNTLDHSRTKKRDKNEEKHSKSISKAITKATAKQKSPEEKLKVPFETERPRTATLRKGSIVNSNIAGPDIPKSETPSLTSLDLNYEQVPQCEDEDTYEDDFDSYESDFEEYHSSDSASSSLSSNEDNLLTGEEITSSDGTASPTDIPKCNTSAGTDEERMLDSGNFDMPENKHKQLLDNIKESSEKENLINESTENNFSNMGSLSDEGFEEGKSSLHSGSMQCINFVDAQKKMKQSKSLQKRRKRGEDILNMIRLDHYNFTLIDMPPVSYDVFIKSYGQTNAVQVPTQTGDDDTSEEIQTENIEIANKWTQFPISFSKIDDTKANYLEIYKREYLGVGDDFFATTDSILKQINTNNKQLEKFLSFAGQTVLTLLDESLKDTSKRLQQNPREIPFSDGYIKFDVNIHTFLKNRPVNFVSYCSTTNIKILTVHGRNKEVCESEDNNFSLKTVICIWSLLNLTEPEKLLVVTGDINCCCIIIEYPNLIFGGLCDGSLATWDLAKDDCLYNIKNSHFLDPSYVTDINSGHFSKVVSIHPLMSTTDEFVDSSFDRKSRNNQICSLDESGVLIIWGIITRTNFSFNILINQPAVPWNQISLVKNSKLSLTDFNPDLRDLHCTDMNINFLNPSHLFITTNYGCVIHCLATGNKANPKKYFAAALSQANCLETCPFSPLYFFTGHENGAIVLYSHLLEKPLMVMSNKDDSFQSGIQLLQWSYHKPCVFYAKDRGNTIHVWDLTISDLYPIYSIPFKENITCMKLSPTVTKTNDASYMILATENGTVHLHLLNADYGSSDSERYQQDVKKFLNYVSRL